jgi:hypothetical protein
MESALRTPSMTTAILSRICKTASASHTRHVLHFVIPSYDYNLFFLEPDCAEKTKNANIVSRLHKHLLKMAKYVLFAFRFW